MMTRRRSTPSWAKIACWDSPVRPAAQVWVEIGTPVAFWARADARRMFSMTGVTPAVSVAHLMMAALTPVAPMPCWISRMKSAATSSTPCPLKYRSGIHQTPVATITWTRERRATCTIKSRSRPRSTVVRSTIARIPRACRSAILALAERKMADLHEDAGAIPQVRPVLLHPGGAGDDVLVHQRGSELGGGDRTARCLHRRRHGDLQPAPK